MLVNPLRSHTVVLLVILVIIDIGVIVFDSFHQLRYVIELFSFQSAAFVAVAAKNSVDNWQQVKYQTNVNLPGPGR